MDVSVSPTRSWANWLRALDTNPWFAYLTLLVLQVSILWFAWQGRDLTSGDTSSYFLGAWDWYTHARVNIVWSPLYAAFYGTMLHISSDVYVATLLHRLVIVCSATLLVLAVLRRLLPTHLAWWIAVWWAVLPINFDTLYEIHLFALLPILGAWLAVLSIPGAWGRGLCLGILSAATILVRNELSVACFLFGMCCLIYEWRAWRRGASGPFGWGRLLAAHTVPLLGAVVLIAGCYLRSTVKYPALRDALRVKHTLNMSQVFTFGYLQRHPEVKQVSPWTEYHEVMQQHFGNTVPSLGEMLVRNPWAALEHFGWNFALTPNGLQVLLFNATSGTENPDYAPVITGSQLALVLSLLLGAIWVAGLWFLVRNRSQWWQTWLQPRAMAWCALLAVGAVALVVIPTQRPRPSYLFGLSVVIMAGTGTFLMVLLSRLRLPRVLTPAVPILMLVFVIVVPWTYRLPQVRPQYLRMYVQRMQPFAPLLRKPAAVAFHGEFAYEITSFVAHRGEGAHSRELLKTWPSGMSLDTFFREEGVNLVDLDEFALCEIEKKRPCAAQPFLAGEPVGDWQLLAAENRPGHRWRLYARPPLVQPAPQAPESAQPCPQNQGPSDSGE